MNLEIGIKFIKFLIYSSFIIPNSSFKIKRRDEISPRLVLSMIAENPACQIS